MILSSFQQVERVFLIKCRSCYYRSIVIIESNVTTAIAGDLYDASLFLNGDAP